MLPHVIIHNALSADGRMDWLNIDLELYYKIAIGFQEDATLSGSNTILGSDEEIPEETEEDLKPPKVDPDDKRPILVIPDSKGRVRIWHALKRWPYWRKFVALITDSTSKEYIEYLDKRHVEHLVVGKDKVDLRAALEELNKRYGVTKVRTDSGGTLNGILLRQELVSEISILVNPSLVGGTSPKSIFRAPDLTSSEGVIKLKLAHVEQLKDDVVWLRYEVVK